MCLSFLDCCCVKWGGLKPHIEWVNVPVCYHPSKYYYSYVLLACVSIVIGRLYNVFFKRFNLRLLGFHNSDLNST